jgi:hypothetical protein
MDGHRDPYANMQGVGPDSSQELMPQSVVHYNGDVDKDVVEQRKRDVMSLSPKEYGVIGANNIEALYLDIAPNEPLFLRISDQRMLQDAKTTFRARIFSSFNGLHFKKGQSQESFENEFVLVGVARSHFVPEGDTANSGVAVQISGSVSILNTGKDVFFPNDVVGIQIPFIDETKRTHQFSTARSRPLASPQSINGKFTGTAYKVTYRGMMGTMSRVVDHLVRNNAKISVPQYRELIKAGQVASISELTAMATLTKQFSGVSLLSNLRSLMELGYITTTTGGIVNLDDPVAFTEWATTRSQLTNADANKNIHQNLREHVWLPGTPAEIRQAVASNPQDASLVEALSQLSGHFVKVSVPMQTQRRTAVDSFLKQVAGKAGLIDLTEGGNMGSHPRGEDTTLTRTTAITTFWGSMSMKFRTDPSLMAYVYEGMGDTKQPDSTIINFDRVTASDDPVIALRHVVDEASPALARVWGWSYANTFNKVLGTAMRFCRPNTMLDVCVRI